MPPERLAVAKMVTPLPSPPNCNDALLAFFIEARMRPSHRSEPAANLIGYEAMYPATRAKRRGCFSATFA
jgi:hypothetical protein